MKRSDFKHKISKKIFIIIHRNDLLRLLITYAIILHSMLIFLRCRRTYVLKSCYMKKTRTKTSIRYAKENDREKTERRRERERKVEGEI